MSGRNPARDISWYGKSVRTGLFQNDTRIAKLRVEISQSILGDEHRAVHHRFRKDDCPTLLGCANVECPFGQHDLRAEIEAMIEARETEREVSFYCARMEGTPAGRKMYSRSCMWSATGKVSVAYAEPAAP